MKHFVLAVIASCALTQAGQAQDAPTSAPEKYTAHNKGKWSVFWGGNRDSYTKSDITFWGNGYHFTLTDVAAHDKPKGIHVDYVNPGRMTIPQTNFRIGYFVTDHYQVSIGLDHMKYVMTQNQTVNMTGTISGHEPFNGTYDHEPMVMTENFLKFEHTDGLNYVNAEFSRYDDITGLFHWDTDKVQLNTLFGAGAGMLYPKTNTTLMGMQRHDDFHISGYGIDAKAGLNITFFKHFFLQGELKGGYINMPDVRTTFSDTDHAKQHFLFFERVIALGGIFRV